jgi:hypothetical protein
MPRNHNWTRRTGSALLAVLAALCLTAALAAPASAGPVTRTASWYDLTQCPSATYCAYSTPSPAAWVYLKAAPLVTATSYYDSHITTSGSTYQRVYDSSHFKLLNWYDSLQITANPASPTCTSSNCGDQVHVICYTYDSTGRQFDKVALYTDVNNDLKRWYIAYVLDSIVADYVVDGRHRC